MGFSQTRPFKGQPEDIAYDVRFYPEESEVGEMIQAIIKFFSMVLMLPMYLEIHLQRLSLIQNQR